PAVIYAGADYCGVFKSTDGGGSWSFSNTGMPSLSTTVSSLAIDPLAPSVIYAGVDTSAGAGGFYKSIDGGQSWRLSSSGLGNLNVRALVIDPAKPSTLYVGTGDPCPNCGVFKSTNGGENWNLTGLSGSVLALAIDPKNPSTLYASTPFHSDDAFVAKLNAMGSELIYSTYLGGSGDDRGNSIALDAAGNAYIVGVTSSTDFPTAEPLQPSLKGKSDAFVAKLNPAGSALVYSTYLGGDGDDEASDAALDALANVYVTGTTSSNNFPTTPGVVKSIGRFIGNNDAFVTKLNATGTGLVYSTYLGGSEDRDFCPS